MRTRYIGLDLAWSARNLSGAAALAGGPAGAELLEEPALLRGLGEIVEFVARHAGAGPAIVAVDAPLWVPNEAGLRPAEAALARDFRSYEAGAHPANRRLLAREGGEVRGELLVRALEALSPPFRHADRVGASEPGRIVVEVFPHPAMVAIFDLPRTLKYKARPGRGPDERLAAWARYRAELRALEGADPPMRGQGPLLEVDPGGLGPAALKRHEDRVDALFCAYVALYAHRWGAARCRTFGDMEGGYIFTPVPAALR